MHIPHHAYSAAATNVQLTRQAKNTRCHSVGYCKYYKIVSANVLENTAVVVLLLVARRLVGGCTNYSCLTFSLKEAVTLVWWTLRVPGSSS